MWIEEALDFISKNKEGIVATMTVLAEGIVIAINAYRKTKAVQAQIVSQLQRSFDATSILDKIDEDMKEEEQSIRPLTFTQFLLWTANPVNLFRKP